MVITIDGQPQTQIETEGQTMGDVLNRIRKDLSSTGRMVVGIICDGQAAEPQQIQTLLTEPVQRYTEVDFQTAVPAELAKNSLEACQVFLTEIEENAGQVVEALRRGQIQEAMRDMGPMFGRLSDTYRGLQGTFELFKIDPESIELSSGHAGRFMTLLRDKLKQIRDTLENQDYVSLADLIEYELVPALGQWRQLNEHLLESLPNP